MQKSTAKGYRNYCPRSSARFSLHHGRKAGKKTRTA